jgi:flagellar protein FliJ
MKKFRFPLRSVETVRSITELRAREHFSQAVTVHADTVRALVVAREALAGLEDLIREQRRGHFRPAEQVTFSKEIQVREERVKVATQAEAEAALRLESARAQWVEARKQLRVVEKLEQKARSVHRAECEHEEQALMDDRVNAVMARMSIAS